MSLRYPYIAVRDAESRIPPSVRAWWRTWCAMAAAGTDTGADTLALLRAIAAASDRPFGGPTLRWSWERATQRVMPVLLTPLWAWTVVDHDRTEPDGPPAGPWWGASRSRSGGWHLYADPAEVGSAWYLATQDARYERLALLRGGWSERLPLRDLQGSRSRPDPSARRLTVLARVHHIVTSRLSRRGWSAPGGGSLTRTSGASPMTQSSFPVPYRMSPLAAVRWLSADRDEYDLDTVMHYVPASTARATVRRAVGDEVRAGRLLRVAPGRYRRPAPVTP